MVAQRKAVLTKEIIEQICHGIEKAGTLQMAEKKGYLPYDVDTIRKLTRENPEFDQQVKKSKDEGIMNLLEDTITIAFDESRDVITTDDGKVIPNHVAPIRDKLKIDAIHRRIGGARKIHGFSNAPTVIEKFNIICQNFAAGNISPAITAAARSLCDFQFTHDTVLKAIDEQKEIQAQLEHQE